MSGKGRNVQFSVLQAFAILLVVIGHKGGFRLFTDWFPIYAFHMPLFFFISGYFYKQSSENSVGRYIVGRVKKLVLPYFIFNLLYGVLVNILRAVGFIEMGQPLGLKSLFILPWQGGNQFGLNVASWFVLGLFLVQAVYILLRKLAYSLPFMNEYLLFLLVLAMGLAGVQLAYNGYREQWWTALQYPLYGIPFFHAGFLYKQKLEMRDKLNNAAYFLLVFAGAFATAVILGPANNHISMWNAVYNKLDSVPVMAFITPLWGILFWLRLSRILAPAFQNSRLIQFVSENTWTVMMHHQLAFFAFNCVLVALDYAGLLQSFDTNAFRTDAWYGYQAFGNGNFLFLYVVIGMAVPLGIKYLLVQSKTKNRILNYWKKIF